MQKPCYCLYDILFARKFPIYTKPWNNKIIIYFTRPMDNAQELHSNHLEFLHSIFIFIHQNPLGWVNFHWWKYQRWIILVFLGVLQESRVGSKGTTKDCRIVVHIEIDIHVAFDKELLEWVPSVFHFFNWNPNKRILIFSPFFGSLFPS
jgi:membrane-bound metal-dependent hydrolase YbcI (DUF457 family)